MFKKLFILGLLMMPMALVACKTTVDGRNDKVIIDSDYDGYGHPHDGGFCPPGQAKKGNC